MNFNIRTVLWAPALAFLLESAAFFLFDFSQLPLLARMYPQMSQLEHFCSSNNCLYNPSAVASLYGLQFLTFAAFCFAFLLAGRKSDEHVEVMVRAIFCTILAGVILEYLRGNFAFNQRWIFPNQIASSPSGVFRYVLFFSLGAVSMAVLSNAVTRTPDASSVGR